MNEQSQREALGEAWMCNREVYKPQWTAIEPEKEGRKWEGRVQEQQPGLRQGKPTGRKGCVSTNGIFFSWPTVDRR